MRKIFFTVWCAHGKSQIFFIFTTFFFFDMHNIKILIYNNLKN
jgi:hypothetical protein